MILREQERACVSCFRRLGFAFPEQKRRITQIKIMSNEIDFKWYKQCCGSGAVGIRDFLPIRTGSVMTLKEAPDPDQDQDFSIIVSDPQHWV